MSKLREQLRSALSELDRLTQEKPDGEARLRINFLLAQVGALRDELKSITSISREEIAKHAWHRFANDGIGSVERYLAELRDQGTGAPVASSLQGSLGAFVPNDFFYKFLPMALKQWDPLFDEDIITLLETQNARPMLVPNISAIATLKSPNVENAQGSFADTDDAGQVVVRGFLYRSPMWRISREAVEDLEESYGALEMFKRFIAQRIALSAGQNLMMGSGASQTIPLGLLPAVKAFALGVGATAAGSNSNTGGSETGANSIGSNDLAGLYHSVNPAYRASPKAGWIMHDNTLSALRAVITKQGIPLLQLVGKEDADGAEIYGRPVYTSPSMPTISTGAYSVIFGDLSFWLTRITPVAITRFDQAAGTVESGKVGFRAMVRADGVFMFHDTVSTPPIRLLRQA